MMTLKDKSHHPNDYMERIISMKKLKVLSSPFSRFLFPYFACSSAIGEETQHTLDDNNNNRDKENTWNEFNSEYYQHTLEEEKQTSQPPQPSQTHQDDNSDDDDIYSTGGLYFQSSSSDESETVRKKDVLSQSKNKGNSKNSKKKEVEKETDFPETQGEEEHKENQTKNTNGVNQGMKNLILTNNPDKPDSQFMFQQTQASQNDHIAAPVVSAVSQLPSQPSQASTVSSSSSSSSSLSVPEFKNFPPQLYLHATQTHNPNELPTFSMEELKQLQSWVSAVDKNERSAVSSQESLQLQQSSEQLKVSQENKDSQQSKGKQKKGKSKSSSSSVSSSVSSTPIISQMKEKVISSQPSVLPLPPPFHPSSELPQPHFEQFSETQFPPTQFSQTPDFLPTQPQSLPFAPTVQQQHQQQPVSYPPPRLVVPPTYQLPELFSYETFKMNYNNNSQFPSNSQQTQSGTFSYHESAGAAGGSQSQEIVIIGNSQGENQIKLRKKKGKGKGSATNQKNLSKLPAIPENEDSGLLSDSITSSQQTPIIHHSHLPKENDIQRQHERAKHMKPTTIREEEDEEEEKKEDDREYGHKLVGRQVLQTVELKTRNKTNRLVKGKVIEFDR
jgi:hypothetical protein